MEEQKPPHRGWIANLSNGLTAFEGEARPGETSAWQQLLAHIKKEGLKITGMRLQKAGLTLHALPNKACDGYYQAYEVRMNLIGEVRELRQGIGSVVSNKVIITWADDSGNVWQEIRDLDDGERVHSTLA
jgi:hypothetical protein